MSSQPNAGQAKVGFSDWLCMTHFAILCDMQTYLVWCLKRMWSQKYHPFALTRRDTLSVKVVRGSSVTSARLFTALVLGQIFLFELSELCLLWHMTGIFCLPFTKKQITVGPCQKSGERQQCSDNPRVKGVNMRREFHAWQVRRMAPVFSLFTHANEQYADEQTCARPAPPACCTKLAGSMWLGYLLTNPPCVI